MFSIFQREENSTDEHVERASQTEIMKTTWGEEGILIGDLLGVECQSLKRITKKIEEADKGCKTSSRVRTSMQVRGPA